MYRRFDETYLEKFKKLIFIFVRYSYDTSESFSLHLPSVYLCILASVKLTSVPMTIGIVVMRGWC